MNAELVWLLIAVAMLLLEGVNYMLVSIWFAVGAFAAMIATICGVSDPLAQTGVFLAVSAILLIFTRPLARKALGKTGITPTNADSLIGKSALVTKTINPTALTGETGEVKVDGKIWRARSESGAVMQEGEFVTILRIEGVTLIVSKQNIQ